MKMALIYNMSGYLFLRDNTGAHEDEIIRRIIIVLETAYSLVCFTMLRPTLHGHTKVGTVARIKMTSKLLEAKSMHAVSEFTLGMYSDDRSVLIGSYLGILHVLSRGYRVNGTRRWQQLMLILMPTVKRVLTHKSDIGADKTNETKRYWYSITRTHQVFSTTERTLCYKKTRSI